MDRDTGKKALIIRYGALGDHVILTPIFPLMKADGFHITMNTVRRGKEVLKCNPYIDEWMDHDSAIPPNDELQKHWDKISQGFDKVINLSESIEGRLAKVEYRDDFYDSQERRHLKCNKNFYDHTLESAGYPEVKGKNGELYFSRLEEKLARAYRNKYGNKFLIVWSLAGSSVDKAYPFAEFVAKEFLDRYSDSMIITVGDEFCRLIEWEHSRTKNYSGKWDVRMSLIMTKYADLVIGTDTGIMHAAGCFDTPKILMLSSNTVENISKYWDNCVSLSAGVSCQPCHRIHYSRAHCLLDSKLGTPLCMSTLNANDILFSMEQIYESWKEGERGIFRGQG